MDDVLFDKAFKKKFAQLQKDIAAFAKSNWIIAVIVTIGALGVLIIQQIVLSILNKSL